MERRNFIRLSLTTAGAALSLPAISLAENRKPLPTGADIFYTKEDTGRWAGKAATHLPVIEISKTAAEATVKITTPHEMKGYEHYIVKHILLDKDHKFINEHMFDPSKDSIAISSFTLKNYSGSIYALSFCNKHDLWLAEAEI
ncbi:hypothetical protein KEF85_12540 [Methylomonas paludis]|uniref:Desulfoferrodoxin ferrous iron-binding domain-containing protein n=1 Tax=Methylomonas paludis TaxID=1173101 RepID=A0A975MLT6_9GAMM|nr:desulfoferrodoxin family protein [Methylomonas paludis]QWF70167.1 hypothetical protein KEF85_12540 [Methylomonas paludis]